VLKTGKQIMMIAARRDRNHAGAIVKSSLAMTFG
jgi:hypothetical protein